MTDNTSTEHKGFTKAPNDLIYDTTLSDGALRQYLVLRHHNRSGRCFPDRETLAEETGVSLRTVDRRNRELIAHELIAFKRRGFSKSNEYDFLDPSISVTDDANEETQTTHSISATDDANERASVGEWMNRH